MDQANGTTKEDVKLAKEQQKDSKKRKKEAFKELKKSYKKNNSKFERFKNKLTGKEPKWKKIDKYYTAEQMEAAAQEQKLEAGGRHI